MQFAQRDGAADPFAPAAPEGLLHASPELAAPVVSGAQGGTDPQAALALFGGLFDGASATAKPKGPKRTATKEENARIQGLIDRSRKAEAEAASLAEDAEILEGRKDPKAREARRKQAAKIREAHGYKREAMAAAVSAYAIDITHVSKLEYGADNDGGESTTDDDRAVSIGNDAFQSPGWLASTIGHEAEVHAKQAHDGRNYAGQQGRDLNETEAYDWEIRQAARFGLTPAQIDSARRSRAHYLNELDPEVRKLRDQGIYRMPKGREED